VLVRPEAVRLAAEVDAAHRLPRIEADLQRESGGRAAWRIPPVEEPHLGDHEDAALVVLATRHRVDRHVLDAERLEVEAHPLVQLLVEVRVAGPVSQPDHGHLLPGP
jgi:hypothetical protein